MKPKCPKCGASVWLRGFFNQRHGSMRAICRNGRSCWSRCVSRAAIIRLAVEPKKPETCKWQKLVGELYASAYRIDFNAGIHARIVDSLMAEARRMSPSVYAHIIKEAQEAKRNG